MKLSFMYVSLSFQRLYQLKYFHQILHKYYSIEANPASTFSFPTACNSNMVKARICVAAGALNKGPLNETQK